MADDISDNEDGSEAKPAGPGIQAELIRSYLSFAARAIRPRWGRVFVVILLGMTLTGAAARYAPRTYKCTTVLMALSNPVLDSNNNGPGALAGAPTLITRQENLQTLVKDTGLARTYDARRPAILKLKDRATQWAFGKWSDETRTAILVGTLQSRLAVGSDAAGNLAISVEWTDGKTAAELAEAAREGFLKIRHNAEISAFEVKMAILDEHATKMRAEVEALAKQINDAHEQRTAQLTKSAGTRGAAVAAPIVRLAPRRTTTDFGISDQLPDRKAKLADAKRRLVDLENDRERRLREEQGKLTEMKLHLTPSHPQVVLQEERIGILMQVPSEVALLRSEVADLERTLKQSEALAAHGSSIVAGGPMVASGASPGALPNEIIQALESEQTDPALSAQISGAVVRYGSLRDEIRGGRMALDTAQAAFDHRYQIVVPAEVPNQPIKPKPAVIFGTGLAISLVLALLLPLLAELRRGVIIERWQVQQMQLPVLAELRLPPHSSD